MSHLTVAWAILHMFDSGIDSLINGPNIDQPYNALTLTLSLHREFGQFDIYFEPVSGAVENTYAIRRWESFSFLHNRFPVTRTLVSRQGIRVPEPRLLAIHRAIGQILHLSAAGEYVLNIVQEMNEFDGVAAEDGSSNLGQYLSAKLGGGSAEVAVH